MALNPGGGGGEGKKSHPAEEEEEEECGGTEAADSSRAAADSSNQNGDQQQASGGGGGGGGGGCGEDTLMSEQGGGGDPDRRRKEQGQGPGQHHHHQAQAAAPERESVPPPGRSSMSPAAGSGHGRPPGEELPLPRRSSFQIPRKTKGGKATGMYDFLPPDSRGFEDLKQILSRFYLDQSSRGTFTYCKARLIHNELLEKEFIEKRRAMKQEGRTEAELAESYCFLFPDKARLQWICEKGLSVGHSRNNILGNPASGVYLSKNSDLLQINPFEAGSYGDMIIFKVMRGRVKYIFDSMPKNAVEPTQKFDCHMSKNANRVSSLLSYRAFELTQQYFFEFAFEEIKARPRHVCPYAVLSFTYKGKDAASLAPLTPHRFNIPPQSTRGKCCYTVWSGPLMNKGQEMFHVCVRSSTRPYLPFKLPERLDLSRGMQLDQAKRKIPAVLFSWDTYSITREVMKCGMFCSLFEVVDGKGKPTNGSLAGLVHKLERDRMVLVQPLFDKGFLFLLTSTQMVGNERWGRVEKSLQALFIFQEARTVAKYPPRGFDPVEPLLPPDLQPAALQPHVEPFLPALHYALFKLRTNPGKDLSAGVEHRAHEYLVRLEGGTVRPFTVPDYKQNLDERGNNYPAPRAKHNIEGQLRTYVHNPGHYMFALAKARGMIDKIQNPVPMPIPVHVPGSMNMVPSALSGQTVGGLPLPPAASSATPAPTSGPPEYSPVSDWGGSDMGSSDRTAATATSVTTERPAAERLLLASERSSAERLLLPDGAPGGGSGSSRRSRSGLSHSNGSQSSESSYAATTQGQKDKEKYDKDKMKELLKLIHQHKKNITPETGGPDQRRPGGGEDPWDPHGLLEQERSRPGAEDPWDPHSLKRKMEADGEWGGGGRGGASKHPRLDPMSNGEPSRVPPTDESSSMDGDGASFNLAAVLKGMDMYDTDLRAAAGGGGANNNDSSSVNETQRLLKILLATLNKAMTHSGIEPPNSLDLELPGGSSSSSSGGPPGARSVPDADHRKPREELLPPAAATPTANYAAEDMDCSPASPFSPGSPVEPSHTSDTPSWVIPIHQEALQTAAPTEAVATVDGLASPKPLTSSSEVKKVADVKAGAAAAAPEVKKAEVMKAAPEVKKTSLSEVKRTPVVEVKKPASPPPPRIHSMVEEPQQRPSISLDTILNQEVYSLTSDIRSLMHTQRVYYASQLPQRLPPQPRGWRPNRAFSGFVAPYVTPAPGLVGAHLRALAERMGPLLPPPPPTPPPPTTHVAADPKVTSPAAHAQTGSDLTSPNPPPVATTTTTTTTPKTKSEPSQSKSARRPGGGSTRDHRGGSSSSSKAKTESSLTDGVSSEMYSPSRVTPGSPEQQQATALPPSGSALLANSLIGQLKPEVFSSLMEVFKDVTKNTVKFYIHSEQEGNGSKTICTEIQEYLQSLGNRECVPQAFLENSGSMDKLLIIIQNTDIAAHVHKIPALVSLKKLSSVSFAGVDSLDDVKNHTYNELFVSGGFIVSDEFVLNPDLISQERLQALLSFLEQQSTPEHPWQWKVHCKSQKKLKELARLNSNAMGLLNLLTVYQKKHLVEFLPYHECDTASRQAPDLDCLVKLQAQHTQQRHLIFLTERPFEMFLQYSRNGIVIASIDDIMTSFHSLIGSIDQNDLPTPPSTAVNDECVEAEDMSLDSDDGAESTPHPATATVVPAPPEPPSSSEQQNQKLGPPSSAVAQPPSSAPPAEKQPPPQPPPPENEEFRPPLPGGDTASSAMAATQQQSSSTPGSTPLNPSLSAALSTALSQFKASNLQLASGTTSELGGGGGGGMSPGGFAVNPHQSFLCPTASWGASYLSAAAAGVGAYTSSASAVASAVASPVAYPASPPQPPPPPPQAPAMTTIPQEYPPRPPAPPPLPATATTTALQTPAPSSPLVSSVPTPPPPPSSLLTPAALSSLLTSAPSSSLLTAGPSLLSAAPSLLASNHLAGVGPLGSNLASLPMEVKPPPPPHLMMLGHVYGSDPPPSTPPHGASPGSGLSSSSSAYGADMSGLLHNSSPGGGDNSNRTGGASSSSDASTMPGGALAHSGLLQAAVGVGLGEWSSHHQASPGSQGARTPADCSSDSLGGSCVGGVPTAGPPRGPGGGGVGAPLLLRPQLHHPPAPHPLGGSWMGALPGQMDPHQHHHQHHHRGALMGGPGASLGGGGYRGGRGVVPPALQWPRPGLGEGGGGPCNPWGYPMGRGRGQDYYTYSHNYSP